MLTFVGLGLYDEKDITVVIKLIRIQLQPNAKYTLIIDHARDKAGNELAGQDTINFTTGD